VIAWRCWLTEILMVYLMLQYVCLKLNELTTSISAFTKFKIRFLFHSLTWDQCQSLLVLKTQKHSVYIIYIYIYKKNHMLVTITIILHLLMTSDLTFWTYQFAASPEATTARHKYYYCSYYYSKRQKRNGYCVQFIILRTESAIYFL